MNSFENTFISLIIMIFLGYLLKKSKFLKSVDAKPLNIILINILLPCMIFMALYSENTAIFSKLSMMPFIPLFPALFVGLFTFIILKFYSFSKIKILGFISAVILGNTAYLGYPIVSGIFGDDGLVRAIFFDISTPILFLFLSIILIISSGGSLKDSFKKVLGFPVLWGVSFGIIFNIFNIPIGDVLENTIKNIGVATVPLAMFSLGLSLDFSRMKKNIKIVSFISSIKLILYPLLSFVVVILLNLTELEFKVGIIESARPSSILSLILASNYGLDHELVADCIFLSTILSFITLPIIISLL
ncbi:MAG: AEC family transporter [Methanobrevibacter sp.]|jgi:predicted permease|nr:AEC family transporter [Methanobrevibacter sp.]